LRLTEKAPVPTVKLIAGQVAFSFGIFPKMSKGAFFANFEVTQLTKDLEQSFGFACASAGLGKRKILDTRTRERSSFIGRGKTL
jgi:hypothetical protein